MGNRYVAFIVRLKVIFDVIGIIEVSIPVKLKYGV
jgi:hypothetical protein